MFYVDDDVLDNIDLGRYQVGWVGRLLTGKLPECGTLLLLLILIMMIITTNRDLTKNKITRWVGKLPECEEERGEEAGCGGLGDCQQVLR